MRIPLGRPAALFLLLATLAWGARAATGTMTAVAGTTPQTTFTSTAFPVPLAVKITDNTTGAPIAGVDVYFSDAGTDFSFPGGAAMVFTTTDAQGIATAPTLTAGTRTGTFQVFAGVPLPTSGMPVTLDGVNFNLTVRSAATPGQKHWSGGGSGRWSDPASWTELAAPVAGDLLIFPDVLNGTTSSTDDLPDPVAGILVQGAGAWSFYGSVRLSGDAPIRIENARASVTFPNAVAIDSRSATIHIVDPEFPSSFPNLYFGDGLHVSGGSVTFDAPGARVSIRNGIQDSGRTTVTASCLEFKLDGHSVIGAPLHLAGGTMNVVGSDPLGSTTSGATVDSGVLIVGDGFAHLPARFSAPLVLRGPNDPAGNVRFNGQGGDNVRLDAPISIAGTQTISFGQALGSLTGPITGTGKLLLPLNSWPIAFGNPANSFSGGLRIDGYGTVSVTTPDVIPDSGPLELASQVTLELHNGHERVGAFSCGDFASLDLLAGTVLEVGGGAATMSGNCALRFTVPVGYSIPPTGVLVARHLGGLPWSGTFGGYAEGALVGGFGVPLAITYRGGASGSDIVLITPDSLTASPDRVGVAPGASFPFSAVVKSPGGTPVPGVTVAFEVSGSGAAAPSTFSVNAITDSNGTATGRAVANGSAGAYDIVARYAGRSASIHVTQSAPDVPVVADYQDMWWAGMAENGWGVSVVQHANKLFAVIYAYDSDGKPTWFVMPAGTWDATSPSYWGDLYHPAGSPFFSYDVSRFAAGTAIGSAAFSFDDADHARLAYTINGVSGVKAIIRQPFGPVGGSAIQGRGDMWWGGVSQNGWGIAVLQQNATLFSVWFTYDANGAPTWYVMPGGTWSDADTYSGRIYRTTGSPWVGHAYDPAQLQVTDVGPFRLHFSGETATFDYTVEGRSGTLSLSRQGF